MKHKTWFRLVLKAVGVLLVGLGIPEFLTLVIGVVHAFVLDQRWTLYSPYDLSPLTRFASVEALISMLLSALPAMAQVGFGLYLFFGGKWIVDKVIPSNRPYCPDCGYDLSKASSATCPECGVALPKQPAAQ